MGRKTFESLPKGPLPNRKNVILTTMPEAGFVNCFACESMGAALDICEKKMKYSSLAVLWYIVRRYVSQTRCTSHAYTESLRMPDTFFPVVNWDMWEEVERQEFPADAKHAYPYTFLTYHRKK